MDAATKDFRLATVGELNDSLDRIKAEMKYALTLINEIVEQGEEEIDMTRKEGLLLQQMEAAQKEFNLKLRAMKQNLGRVRTRLEQEEVK